MYIIERRTAHLDEVLERHVVDALCGEDHVGACGHTGLRVRVRFLRGQSRIRDSLPLPGFSESGIHLASATGKTPWIHVQGFINWAEKNLDSGFFFRGADFPRRVKLGLG